MFFENEVQEYLDTMLVTLNLCGFQTRTDSHRYFLYYCQISNENKSVVLELSPSHIFTSHLYIFSNFGMKPFLNISSRESSVLEVLQKTYAWLGGKDAL